MQNGATRTRKKDHKMQSRRGLNKKTEFENEIRYDSVGLSQSLVEMCVKEAAHLLPGGAVLELADHMPEARLAAHLVQHTRVDHLRHLRLQLRHLPRVHSRAGPRHVAAF